MPDARTIHRFSPNTVLSLRRCGLATYRRRSRSWDGGSPSSNPVARLGNAAHRVLEWVANEASQLEKDPLVEDRVRDRWDLEIQVELAASRQHFAERSFGPLEQWPRYAVTQESLVVDGAALAAELAAIPPDRRWTERKLTTAAGDLYGTVDLVVVADAGVATVIDHKAGAVESNDVGPAGRYRAQVLLYAAMVRDQGVDPVEGQIRPLGRAPIDIDFTSATIDAAYAEARADVKAYNRSVEAGAVIETARPSDDACRWCEFLLDCPAIWSAAHEKQGNLHNLEGTIVQIQRQSVGPTAIKLALTEGGGEVLVRGLNGDRTPAVTSFEAGDQVRIVGLTETSGGTYRPSGGRLDAALVRDLGPVELASENIVDDVGSWRDDGE